MNRQRPWLLAFGIIVNLSVLGYFKYTNFLISNVNALFGASYVFQNIILPIGISFFTFQKIGYLVDAYRGLVKEYDFLSFCLFVMFFPQLIAGPIVHHMELIPQFKKPNVFRCSAEQLTAGIILFSIGLVKKVFIADKLATITDSIFTAVNNHTYLGLIDSWMGAVSFTFQIYFDFSGYTDMALSLALMCGIILPLNFNSPYTSKNMIDFWRRWHMSLSRFMRDYIYISLGGNRHGKIRRYINLFLTMLIGGLWHGASWTFVIWGGLHGFYLIINHGWQAFCVRWRWFEKTKFLINWSSRLLTFFAVVVAWVFFRAENFHSAKILLGGMFGANGISNPAGVHHLIGKHNLLLFFALMLWVWFLPNSQKIISTLLAELKSAAFLLLQWGNKQVVNSTSKSELLVLNKGYITGTLIGAIFACIIMAILAYQAMQTILLHQFIYFQF